MSTEPDFWIAYEFVDFSLSCFIFRTSQEGLAAVTERPDFASVIIIIIILKPTSTKPQA